MPPLYSQENNNDPPSTPSSSLLSLGFFQRKVASEEFGVLTTAYIARTAESIAAKLSEEKTFGEAIGEKQLGLEAMCLGPAHK